MKYKTIFTIVTIFIIAFIVGCGPSKQQRWERFKNAQKASGYEVRSVTASEAWIEKHRDEISIPNQIKFGEPHIVSELPFIGTMIAVDPNDKRIVFLTKAGVKWESWLFRLGLYKDLGYEVLSVTASEAWIEKHRDEISIPNQIKFGEPHIVSELPFIGTMIAVDPNDKRIVIHTLPPGIPPGPFLEDHLDEEESKQWLTDNGYQLSKDTDGMLILQKQRPGFRMNRKLGGKIVGMRLEDGVTLSLINGKIRIKKD